MCLGIQGGFALFDPVYLVHLHQSLALLCLCCTSTKKAGLHITPMKLCTVQSRVLRPNGDLSPLGHGGGGRARSLYATPPQPPPPLPPPRVLKDSWRVGRISAGCSHPPVPSGRCMGSAWVVVAVTPAKSMIGGRDTTVSPPKMPHVSL